MLLTPWIRLPRACLIFFRPECFECFAVAERALKTVLVVKTLKKLRQGEVWSEWLVFPSRFVLVPQRGLGIATATHSTQRGLPKDARRILKFTHFLCIKIKGWKIILTKTLMVGVYDQRQKENIEVTSFPVTIQTFLSKCIWIFQLFFNIWPFRNSNMILDAKYKPIFLYIFMRNWSLQNVNFAEYYLKKLSFQNHFFSKKSLFNDSVYWPDCPIYDILECVPCVQVPSWNVFVWVPCVQVSQYLYAYRVNSNTFFYYQKVPLLQSVLFYVTIRNNYYKCRCITTNVNILLSNNRSLAKESELWQCRICKSRPTKEWPSSILIVSQ